MQLSMVSETHYTIPTSLLFLVENVFTPIYLQLFPCFCILHHPCQMFYSSNHAYSDKKHTMYTHTHTHTTHARTAGVHTHE